MHNATGPELADDSVCIFEIVVPELKLAVEHVPGLIFILMKMVAKHRPLIELEEFAAILLVIDNPYLSAPALGVDLRL